MTPQKVDSLTDELIGRTLLDVAHDLNSHIASLRAALELARLDLEHEHPAMPMVAIALEATDNIDKLRSWLLGFVTRDGMPRHAIDLSRVVADDLPMLTRLFGGRAGSALRLDARLAPDLGLVLAELIPLRQVLLNLVVNARDACGTHGHVIITTANRTIDGAPHVTLSVRDNGAGMSTETRERALGGGHTTKTNGTGRGLVMCRRIVARYGGALDVKSAEQYGTIVTVALPALNPSELAG